MTGAIIAMGVALEAQRRAEEAEEEARKARKEAARKREEEDQMCHTGNAALPNYTPDVCHVYLCRADFCYITTC